MEKPIWECALVAGIGGMMPTLSRFGASLVGDPGQGLPAFGFYIGVGIYFVIGSVLAYAFAERNLKQAFLVGIAAPALIANIVAGVEGSQRTGRAVTGSPVIERKSSDVLEYLIPIAKAENEQTRPKTRGATQRIPLGADTQAREQNREKDDAVKAYSYSIIPAITGAGDWREGVLRFSVTTEDLKGNIKKYEVPLQSTVEINVKEPVKSWQVNFGDRTINIENSLLSNKGGQVVIRAEVETRKDLLWALGARGRPEIIGWGVSTIPNIQPVGEQHSK